jgi:HK97 family phage major capsid protein
MSYNNVVSRTDAAALIPEDVADDLLKYLPKASAALTLFRQVRMSRAQQRMPVLSALPTAYFVDGDTGLKQTTEANWANKYLNVEELAAIVPIPEAVLDDTSFDVWGEIRPLLEEAVGRALDAAIFFGTNKPASWPDDIVTSAAAASNDFVRGTNTAANGGIAADVSEAFALVEAEGFDVNGVIANRAYRGLLRNTRDNDGVRLAEVSPQQVYGVDVSYPMRGIWPATGSSDVELIFGDFMEGIIGLRQDFTYKILDQAVIQANDGSIVYNLAQQDMVALRIVFRVAFQVANILNRDEPTEADRYPFGYIESP